MKIKLTAFILIIFTVISLTGCKPVTEKEAEKRLKKLLSVKFTLKEKEETADQNTYTFIDENGVEFHYISSMDSFGLDGTEFFRYEYGYTDYANASVEHNKEALKSLCDSSGLTYTYNNGLTEILTVSVTSKQNLEAASRLACDILKAQGNIHIKSDSSHDIQIPYMRFEYDSSCYTDIDFLCDGSTLPTYTELYGDLIYDYADAIRRGRISNDLTNAELLSVPPKILKIYYNGKEINDATFYHNRDDGSYAMSVYDLMPPDGVYMGTASLKSICEQANITYTETPTLCKWSIGSHEYYAKYNSKHNTVQIYRDNTVIDSVTVRYAHENSYICDLSLENLAMILSASYETDDISGAVYYTYTEDSYNTSQG